MVRLHPGGYDLQARNLLDQLGAPPGVASHRFHLIDAQDRRLVQNVPRHAEIADVHQQGGDLHSVGLCLAELHRPGKQPCERRGVRRTTMLASGRIDDRADTACDLDHDRRRSLTLIALCDHRSREIILPERHPDRIGSQLFEERLRHLAADRRGELRGRRSQCRRASTQWMRAGNHDIADPVSRADQQRLQGDLAHGELKRAPRTVPAFVRAANRVLDLCVEAHELGHPGAGGGMPALGSHGRRQVADGDAGVVQQRDKAGPLSHVGVEAHPLRDRIRDLCDASRVPDVLPLGEVERSAQARKQIDTAQRRYAVRLFAWFARHRDGCESDFVGH